MNVIRNGLLGALSTFARGTVSTTTGTLSPVELRDEPTSLYGLMRAMAANNNTYKDLVSILPDYGLEKTAMQGLRNPTHAVCSFYEANGWNGTIREDDEQSALPLETPERETVDKLRAGIHQTWRWSNWNGQKDGAFYDAAMLGDQILKVRSDRNTKRAWFELVPPDYMTDLDVDGRGYLTYIRLDVPQIRRKDDGTTETFIHTEVWDKTAMTYRRWERRDLAVGGDITMLGAPAEELDMEQVFGVDFVPFVHWQFDRASDSMRGVPACMRALDKILFGDALVTALHQRLTRYNQSDWLVTQTGLDPDGMPFPAVSISNSGEEITIGDGTKVWSLPSGADMKSLIAGLDYASHLAVVQDHYKALMEYDLPELAWGAISESGGDLSGKAINYKLTAAKSRLEKARGRAESSLIRATQMCLSVAQQLGAPGFGEGEIGRYDRGDFDFWIADREIVPLSESERSEIESQKATRAQTLIQVADNPQAALEAAGYTPDQAKVLAAAAQVPPVTEL